MDINWFPGHMAKTLRVLKENMKLCDAIIEIRDARIVTSSANPRIDELCEGKPRIIILNKNDLSDKKVTSDWEKTLSGNKVKAIGVNCMTGEGIKNIKPVLSVLLKDKYLRYKEKGIINYTPRVMVVGIPNSGKSTFINKMAKNNIAKTGNKPGVTKNKQWIKTAYGMEMLDTPGVLWPRLDGISGINLAFTGAVKDEIIDIEELAIKLIEMLRENYNENIKNRYKIEFDSNISPYEIIKLIALKRGAVLAGNNIDYKRVSVILLDEFRFGKIGRISLERP